MSGIESTTTGMDRLTQILRREAKKTVTLGVLVAVLVVLWGRLMLKSKAPAAARGAEAPVFPTDNLPAAEPQMSEAPGSSLQEWARQPITPIRRNLFSVPLDYYPDQSSRSGNEGNSEQGFWQGLAKSLSDRADHQEQRRILVENVKARAESLKLQSTVMSTQPSAMVNEQMVHEGSSVAGFRILKIEPRRIIVERESVRLEIKME